MDWRATEVIRLLFKQEVEQGPNMLEKNKEGAKPFCKCIKQILRRKW